MAQLVIFLVGIITAATTPIAEKIQAALHLVGIGREDAIPPAFRYLLQPDGTKVAVQQVTTAAPVDHGWFGNWWRAMAAEHPLLSLVLVALVVLYIAYKVLMFRARWAQPRVKS